MELGVGVHFRCVFCSLKYIIGQMSTFCKDGMYGVGCECTFSLTFSLYNVLLGQMSTFFEQI